MFVIAPDKSYPKKTESKSIIRFQDCDPLNHLNNAKYFDYYFNSREDQQALLYGLRADYSFRTYNASWVVYQHQIAYIRPANVSEWVTIQSSVIYFDDTTKVTEYVMTDEPKTQLKNVLWTISKYISVETGRVIPHHPELMDYLNAIALKGVDYQNLTFNQRIKQIKQELAAGQY
ncbi:MAG: acyl-CoA thioesterase [Spirosomataceae bacterium]